jgi:hypothetical protein
VLKPSGACVRSFRTAVITVESATKRAPLLFHEQSRSIGLLRFDWQLARRKHVATKKKPRPVFKLGGAWILATSYFRTTYRCTIIGAAAFHCRVRNGNGWFHCAMVTRGPANFGRMQVILAFFSALIPTPHT